MVESLNNWIKLKISGKKYVFIEKSIVSRIVENWKGINFSKKMLTYLLFNKKIKLYIYLTKLKKV